MSGTQEYDYTTAAKQILPEMKADVADRMAFEGAAADGPAGLKKNSPASIAQGTMWPA